MAKNMTDKPGTDTDLSPSGFAVPSAPSMGESTTGWGSKMGAGKAKVTHEYESFPVNTSVDPANQGANK